MTNDHDKQLRKLTFSQRAGEVPPPEHLKPRHLSKRFRIKVWGVVGRSLDKARRYSDMGALSGHPYYWVDDELGCFWQNFHISYKETIIGIPYDRDTAPGHCKALLEKVILKESYHVVLTAIEHIFRQPAIPADLARELKDCFDDCLYIVDDSVPPVCIVPTTSEENKQNIKRALENISASDLDKVKTPLKKSAKNINDKQFADSVRESISAVECAACMINSEFSKESSKKSSKKFSHALDSLEKHGMLKHPALKEAFKKLYGYASDEEGIRHSKGDKKPADVGFDNAMFIYSVCVCFVDYLISKRRQIKK